MSFPRYPKYKASGAEWLGDVPVHWDVKRLKHVASLAMGQSPSSDDCNSEGNGLPFLQGNADFGDTFPVARSFCPVATKVACPGDILLSVRAPVGAINTADQEYGIGRGLCAIKPSIETSPRYLVHQLEVVKSELFSVATGSTYEAVTTQQVGNVTCAVPPLAEQAAIAEFLDRETGKIDELVAEQERLMELLKEKRQAVISHAVTRGLNPAAPLKPSGIEWLGDVPAHWQVKRLKHISPFITVGVVVNPSSFIADEGLPFIYGGDIREGVIDWVNSRRIDAESCEANSKTKLKAGDLLTVRVGAPGVTAVVPPQCEGGNCASVMLIRQGAFNSQWLCYAMNTRIVRFQVEVVQYGAAQEQFNIAHAVNFWTPTPPRTEQDEIARFLDRETSKFDILTTEAQRAIDLLQERRAALISAAVTGQIDVRPLLKKEAA